MLSLQFISGHSLIEYKLFYDTSITYSAFNSMRNIVAVVGWPRKINFVLTIVIVIVNNGNAIDTISHLHSQFIYASRNNLIFLAPIAFILLQNPP